MSLPSSTEPSRILSRLGFESKRERSVVHWQLGTSKDNAQIVFLERGNSLKLQSLHVSWGFDAIVKSLNAELISLWGRNIRVSHHITDENAIAVMIEISEPPSPSKRASIRQIPPLAIGWTIKLSSDETLVKIFIENITMLGFNAPQQWPADIVQATARAILGRAHRLVTCRSLHELECPVGSFIALRCNPKASTEDLGRLEEVFLQQAQSLHPFSWRYLDEIWTYSYQIRDASLSHADDAAVAATVTPGIEVLESRAAGESLRNVDIAIVNRREDIALHKSNNPVALKRRLLRYLQKFATDLSPEQIEENLNESAFASARSLSAATLIQMYCQKHENDNALDALKKWMDCTRMSHGELESIDALNVILPELAGTILCELDPDQALKAFERAQARQDEPRILAKMVKILGELNDPHQELKVLDRWKHVERRADQIEKITERQVELQLTTSDLTGAAKNLDALILKRPEKTRSWLQHINALADAGEPQKALSLLERIERLTQNHISVTKSDKIAINSTVARIWDQHLGRPDLALPRHMMIIESGDLSDLPSVIQAENALEASGDVEAALTSKKKRWHGSTRESRIQSQELAFKITGLARRLGHFDVEFDIILDLLESGLKIPDLHEFLQSWLQLQFPWRRLVDAIVKTYSGAPIPVKIAHVLAKIVREKLGDHNFAIQLLMQPHIASTLDDQEFYYVVDRLTPQNRQEDLTRFMVDRLSVSSQETKQYALKYLIQHTAFDQDGVINNALTKEWRDSGNAHLMVDRFNSLMESEQEQEISALLRVIQDDLAGSAGVQKLVQELVDAAIAHGPIGSEAALSTLLKLDVELSGKSDKSLQRAVKVLGTKDDTSGAIPYLKELLNLGHAIDLPDQIVEATLVSEPKLLAQFYVYRLKSGNDSERSQFARKCMELLKSGSSAKPYMMPILEQLILTDEIQLEDLSTVRQIAAQLELPKLEVESMASCAYRCADEGLKRQLLQEASRLAMDRLADPKLAFELLDKTNPVPDSALETYERAKLAFQAHLNERSRHLVLGILRSPDCLDSPQIVLDCCRLLIESEEERGLVAGVIQTLLSWAQTSGSTQLGEDLTAFAIQHGFASHQDLSKALHSSLSVGSVDQAVEFIVKILVHATQLGETLSETVEQLKSGLVRQGFEQYWWQLLGKLYHSAHVTEVSSSIRKEIYCQYGLWLYEQEGQQKESLSVLLSLSRENPKERRIWIPIYLLLDELREYSLLVRHLERVIPKVQDDLSILNEYPIHLETLTTSLKKAQDKAKNPIDQPSEECLLAKFSSAPPTESKYRQVSPAELPRLKSGSMDLSKIDVVAVKSEPYQSQIARTLEVGGAAANLRMSDPEVQQAAPLNESVSAPLSVLPKFENLNDNPASFANPSHASSHLDTKSNDEPTQTIRWRELAHSLNAPDDAVERVLRTAFASETEKHMALQVVGLICGNVASLDSWHWRVWRDATEFGYPLSGRDRMPRSSDFNQIGGALHQFLNAFAPVLARHNRTKFTIVDYLQARFPDQRHVMRDVEVSHPVIQRTGLKHHEKRMEQAKIQFVDTPELGEELFLDASTRSIHFSIDACLVKSPGYLMHRAMGYIWSLHLQYHVIMQADATYEIGPLFEIFLRNQTANSIDRIKLAFSPENARIHRLTQGLDRDKLLSLANQAGSMAPQVIRGLQIEMTKNIYRLLLAESLDLIGIFEAITGLTVTSLDRSTIIKLIRGSEVLTDIVAFSSRLLF